MDIYIVRLSECIDSIEYAPAIGITSQRIKTLNNTNTTMDFKRSLIGNLLIRDILIKKYGYAENTITFYYNQFGKPHIDGIYFNISHSEDYVVCAVNKSEVGIDIEYIKPIDFIVAEDFFSTDEIKFLKGLETVNALKYFYTVWTAKESYIKKIGRGIDFNLKSINTSFNDSKILITENGINTECICHTITLTDNYIINVCSSDTSKPKLHKWIF